MPGEGGRGDLPPAKSGSALFNPSPTDPLLLQRKYPPPERGQWSLPPFTHADTLSSPTGNPGALSWRTVGISLAWEEEQPELVESMLAQDKLTEDLPAQGELVEDKPAPSMLMESMRPRASWQRTCQPWESWWRTSQMRTSQS